MKYITRKEAAQMLGVTEQSVSNYVSRGILPGVKRNGRLYISEEGIATHRGQLAEIIDCEKAIEKATEELRTTRKAVMQELAEARNSMGILYRLSSSLIVYAKSVAEDLKGDLDTFEYMVLTTPFPNLLDVADDLGITKERGRQKLERLCHKLECGELLKDSKALRKELEEERAKNLILQNNYEEQVATENDFDIDPIFSQNINEEPLSVRAINCLRTIDVFTVGELVMKNRLDLLKCRNMGKKSLSEIEEYLEGHALHFGMTITDIRNYTRV